MPEFQMNGTDEPAFNSLDEFTQGYIEAMFFTSGEPGTTRETWDPETQSSLPGDVGFDDLAPETLARFIADCVQFQALHPLMLEEAYSRDDYSPVQAGRDFWFTRNGHGVGFWDREQLKGEVDIGEALTVVTKATWSNRDVYLGDDGRIYHAPKPSHK